MASALQCPACGHKHRLSELSGDPIFSCEQCGRLLKTPMSTAGPMRPAPVDSARTNGGTTTSVRRWGGVTQARRHAALRRLPRPPRLPRPSRSAADGRPGDAQFPLQIIGWVFALLIGGYRALHRAVDRCADG